MQAPDSFVSVELKENCSVRGNSLPGNKNLLPQEKECPPYTVCLEAKISNLFFPILSLSFQEKIVSQTAPAAPPQERGKATARGKKNMERSGSTDL